jgi:hypothetical protein
VYRQKVTPACSFSQQPDPPRNYHIQGRHILWWAHSNWRNDLNIPTLFDCAVRATADLRLNNILRWCWKSCCSRCNQQGAAGETCRQGPCLTHRKCPLQQGCGFACTLCRCIMLNTRIMLTNMVCAGANLPGWCVFTPATRWLVIAHSHSMALTGHQHALVSLMIGNTVITVIRPPSL